MHDPLDLILSRTNRPRLGWAVCSFLLALAVPSKLNAAQVYDLLPDNALGFLVVRDVSNTNLHVVRLQKMFDLPTTDLFALGQKITGLHEGLQLNGDALVGLLPGMQPIVFLPIADYAKFATSIHGDPGGAICQVTIAGEEVLLAKKGAHAVLMDLEHQTTLRACVSHPPARLRAIQPLSEWLETTNLSIVAMPRGIDHLLSTGRQAIARERANLRKKYASPHFSEMVKQFDLWWSSASAILEQTLGKSSSVAAAIRIDDSENITLSNKWVLHSPMPNHSTDLSARLFSRKPQASRAITAGHGAVDPSLVDLFAQTMNVLSRLTSSSGGLAGLPDKQWEQVQTSYAKLGEKVNGIAFTMLAGKSKEPLVSNCFFILNVENSDDYLENFKESFELWNAVLATSTSPEKTPYQIIPATLQDRKGYHAQADIAAVLRDPKVPVTNWIAESLFGKEGTFSILALPLDPKRVLVGVATLDQTQHFLEHHLKAENQPADETADETPLAKTAPWNAWLSPKRSVEWLNRVFREFLIHVVPSEEPLKLPEFEESPPVEFSIERSGEIITSKLLLPAKTIEAGADFSKSLHMQ